MSREIKFRAWRLDGGMYKPFDLTNLVSDEYAGESWLDCGDGLHIDHRTGWDSLKIMQYTGLKDKNGKEIYEGDLVQKIYKGKAYQVCEVKFNDGTFVVDDFDADGKKFFWSLRGMQHCWKVVGNIYENPELIGG